MSHDFEQIPGVTAASIGHVGDELTFPFPEVLAVIQLCSANRVAVLGVEIFLVQREGHYAMGCSDYDLEDQRKWPSVKLENWTEYVNYNNALAEQCVHRNPRGDDHVYKLTTASWREFCEIQKAKANL